MYLSSICAATVSYNKYTAIQIFNNQEEKNHTFFATTAYVKNVQSHLVSLPHRHTL